MRKDKFRIKIITFDNDEVRYVIQKKHIFTYHTLDFHTGSYYVTTNKFVANTYDSNCYFLTKHEVETCLEWIKQDMYNNVGFYIKDNYNVPVLLYPEQNMRYTFWAAKEISVINMLKEQQNTRICKLSTNCKVKHVEYIY